MSNNPAYGLWTTDDTNWSQDDTDFIREALGQLSNGSPTSYEELEQQNEAKLK